LRVSNHHLTIVKIYSYNGTSGGILLTLLTAE